MHRKTRPHIPESAFIAKPARIMAILQLCLSFTLICWIGSYPFMGQMLEHKSQLFLFQTVMGGGELVARTYASQPELLSKLERHRLRFASLPHSAKEPVIASYEKLVSEKNSKNFFTQCAEGLLLLFFGISPWVRAWLLFSIVGAVLLLKKSPGAPFAAWIMPLIALIFWIDSARMPNHPSSDAALYPSEKYLLSSYGEAFTNPTIQEQRKILTAAWERYLAAEWSLIGDAEEGEWRFQLERLHRFLNDKKDRENPPSGLLLCLFFLWNSLYAWTAFRYRALSAACATSA